MAVGYASNFNRQGSAIGVQRRPATQPQGLVGMGGAGGLTSDHILSRLQGELQKSREAGAELHSERLDERDSRRSAVLRSVILLFRHSGLIA